MAGRSFFRVSGVVLACAVAAAGAQAQTQRSLTSAERAQLRDVAKTCRRDVSTFCKGIERGDGRILVCLNDNIDSVGAACRAELDAAKPLLDEIEAANGG